MGKQIISQKRGKGSPTYRVRERSYKFTPSYKPDYGIVIDIVSDPGRITPLAKIRYLDGSVGYMLAPEGLKVGDNIKKIVLPLENIPESIPIFGIETYPSSGPKLCRTAGSYAIIVSKDKKSCVVQLPSKRVKTLDSKCYASIGVPAGSGRKEKPWVKAGKKFHWMRVKGKLYPRTSAGAMNVVSHPFGGGYTGLGKPKSVGRTAPPGTKVGAIASKRTGRRKKL